MPGDRRGDKEVQGAAAGTADTRVAEEIVPPRQHICLAPRIDARVPETVLFAGITRSDRRAAFEYV
ncbi:hypothetical protein DMC47_26020 [Nostoc sp. 3335mG]|nr:hypothetical protein DMC47_26020 [Nostoc sp. 3335mG]